MIYSQTQKIVPIIFPQAIVDNDDPVGARGDANPVTVDAKGWDHMTVYVVLGATDIAMTSLSLYASDVSAASGADDADYTAQTDLDFATGNGGPGLPAADDDNKVFAFDVDLRGRSAQRYWILEAGCGNGAAGTFIVAWAVLSRSAETPTTAAERGLESVITV